MCCACTVCQHACKVKCSTLISLLSLRHPLELAHRSHQHTGKVYLRVFQSSAPRLNCLASILRIMSGGNQAVQSPDIRPDQRFTDIRERSSPSRDLNPVEHLWRDVEIKKRKLEKNPQIQVCKASAEQLRVWILLKSCLCFVIMGY